MRRLCWLGVAALLVCGCTKENEAVVTEVATVQNDTTQLGFSEDKLRELIDENIYCNLNVFGLNYLPRGGEPLEYEGRTLYQVDSNVFADYKAFDEYVHSVYCDETAEIFLAPEGDAKARYVNVNGGLFVDINGEGGKGYFVDWQDYSVKIKSQTDTRCDFTVMAKVTWPGDVAVPEDYPVDGVAIFEDGYWVLEKMIY